ALFVLPVIGAWTLIVELIFGARTEKLARILGAEGGLPVDDLPRTPGGRIIREAADREFVKYQAEAEAAPEDWRSWFRLSCAYDASGDRKRARATMRKAISLFREGQKQGAWTRSPRRNGIGRARRPGRIGRPRRFGCRGRCRRHRCGRADDGGDAGLERTARIDEHLPEQGEENKGQRVDGELQRLLGRRAGALPRLRDDHRPGALEEDHVRGV